MIQLVGVIETVYACLCNRTGRQPAGGLPSKGMIRIRMQRVELPRNHDGFRNRMSSSRQCLPTEIIGLEEASVSQAVRLGGEPQRLRLADILVGKETVPR